MVSLLAIPPWWGAASLILATAKSIHLRCTIPVLTVQVVLTIVSVSRFRTMG